MKMFQFIQFLSTNFFPSKKFFTFQIIISEKIQTSNLSERKKIILFLYVDDY